MNFSTFKIWLEGFGEGSGLRLDQVKSICEKLILISGVEIEVREESMENLKVAKAFDYISGHPPCSHKPDIICSSPNCGISSLNNSLIK